MKDKYTLLHVGSRGDKLQLSQVQCKMAAWASQRDELPV
jgi:hypothetical protein